MSSRAPAPGAAPLAAWGVQPGHQRPAQQGPAAHATKHAASDISTGSEVPIMEGRAAVQIPPMADSANSQALGLSVHHHPLDERPPEGRAEERADSQA